MQIATAQLTARLFPEDPFLGMEFGIVARVCLPDWACGARVARPARAARAISVRTMALSLGNSFETTRRHCRQLIARGVFVASPQGVSLAPDEANEPLVLAYYLGVHDRFVRLIEDVSRTCDVDLPVARGRDFDVADVIERGLDVLLQPVDTFRLPGLSRVAHLLWAALTVVAVRGVTYDPLLCRRFGRSIPPDDVRAAISLRRLAAAVGIPYATAWRQLQMLEARGLVTRVGSARWTVLQCNLIARHVQDIAISPSRLLLSKLRELTLLGFDPGRAADYYREVRPALADFGTSAESETASGSSRPRR
jgi:DNA-binding Lrp family transcriptional regulator